MALDHLLGVKSQTQLDIALDHLLGKSPDKSIRDYLISCKVEGKSQRTIDIYSIVLHRFTLTYDPLTAQANDTRLFLLSLQNAGRNPPLSMSIIARSRPSATGQ